MAEERIRIDKWLWQARFFKTRTLAAEVVGAGRLRLNGAKMDKPGRAVGAADVLTFPQGGRIRVVRVLAAGTRRGPAGEARLLYADLDPQPETGVPSGDAAEEQRSALPSPPETGDFPAGRVLNDPRRGDT